MKLKCMFDHRLKMNNDLFENPLQLNLALSLSLSIL